MKTQIVVPLQDREARRVASRATVNVAVTAGAGTGKTTLLVETVLAKLLVHGRDIRRILMLTFTEKAANEMRLRLGKALESLLHPPSEDDKDRRARWEAEAHDVEPRLTAALGLIDRAEIGTIHSFCAHVLREHPVEAGVDPSFVVDEGSRFEAMFRREWPAWLDIELGRSAPRKKLWLDVLEKAKLRELELVARGLASFEVPSEALDPARMRPAGEQRLKAFVDEMQALIHAGLGHCSDPRNKLRAHLAQIAAFLKDPTKGAPAFLADSPGFDRRGWDDFEAARRLAEDAFRIARLVRSVDGELGAKALDVLAEFARKFRKTYTSEGFLSFDGLLMQTRALLKSHRAVRARLKAKYDAILVDEFQDTDPAQCEILLFLAESGSAAEARDVELAPGKLFIVGDPKQSIYSFRGADIVAYADVKKKIAAQGGREEVLRTNFRSHSGIISTVNGVFRTVIREEGDLQPSYEEILPLEGRVPTMPSEAVELTLFEGGDEDEEFSASDARRAEAAWIAKRLKREIGTTEIRDADGAVVKLQRKHVAILFKALTDVHLYLEALRAEGVEYVVEGEKYFYGTSEVVDLTNLLRAVADPHDRIAVAGLLRSPLGGVDDCRLFELRKKLDYRTPLPDEPGVYAVLRELRALVGTLRVAELIDRAFETTCALEIAAASSQGEQAVANLLKLRQTAHALDAHGGLSLRQFVSRTKESVRELEEEGESPLADETLDAVRVLSIHKAKGLEFPVVFLPDLHRRFFDSDERVPVRFDWPTYTLGLRLGKWADAGGAALAWLESRRRREESRRVFYVAMTRARESLILSGGASFKPGSNLGLLREAAPDVLAGSAGEERIAKAGDGEIRVTRLKAPAGRPPAGPKREKAKEGIEAVDWTALAESWRRRKAERDAAAAVFTSPTRKQKEGERERGREGEDEEERREHAMALGSLCHRVLEHIDFKKPEVTKLLDHLADDPSLAAEARPILEAFVRTPAFKELAKGKILARELPFLMRDGEAMLQGAIDLVVKIGSRVVVVDYKTEPASDDAKGRYAEQRRWYLKAVKEVLGIKDAAFRLVFLMGGQVLEW